MIPKRRNNGQFGFLRMGQLQEKFVKKAEIKIRSPFFLEILEDRLLFIQNVHYSLFASRFPKYSRKTSKKKDHLEPTLLLKKVLKT